MTATRSLADLTAVSEQLLLQRIEKRRAEGASDDQIIRELQVDFLGTPSVGSAILKALGGYKQPRPSTVQKHAGRLPDTVGGAVAGALLRGGLVTSIEKGAFGAGPDERIQKAKARLDAPDTGVAHDLTHRIRKAAEAAKETN